MGIKEMRWNIKTNLKAPSRYTIKLTFLKLFYAIYQLRYWLLRIRSCLIFKDSKLFILFGPYYPSK
jgi:hypothetical protein